MRQLSESQYQYMTGKMNRLESENASKDRIIERLKAALTTAIWHANMHNAEYKHVTPAPDIELWKELVK